MHTHAGPTLDAVPRAKPTMKNRNFRCDDPTWQAAQERADARRENLSDVLRLALRLYARDELPRELQAPTHQEDK